MSRPAATPLIFLQYVPLNETLLRLYPMDFLSGRGVPVEYWDISPLYGHAFHGPGIPRPYIRRFASWGEFEAALGAPSLAGALLVPGFAYEPKTVSAYRLLSRSPARLGQIISGVLPLPPNTLGRRLREDLRLLADPGKVARFVLKRAALAARRAGWVRPDEVVFAAGEAARQSAGGARVVPINHYDYDDWLETRGSDPRLVEPRYAVFLDQFLPFHPDFKLNGIRQNIDPGRYYAALNAFFERLERRQGVEIVVAAHPKADYPENPFGGRRLFRSATRALVRRCEFAVTNWSTALSYAILDLKPILFFTSDDIARRYRPLRYDLYPPYSASILGRPIVNLDRPSEEDERVPPVDPVLYDDYKYRYLASRECEGRLSREIYLEFARDSGA